MIASYFINLGVILNMDDISTKSKIMFVAISPITLPIFIGHKLGKI